MERKSRKIGTKRWDAAEHLRTEEEFAAYLDAALEDGDPALVAAALGDITVANSGLPSADRAL